MNRRDFFRSLGVVAGATVVPLPAKPKAQSGMFQFGFPEYKSMAVGPGGWLASNLIVPNPRSNFKLILESDKPMRISGGNKIINPIIYGD